MDRGEIEKAFIDYMLHYLNNHCKICSGGDCEDCLSAKFSIKELEDKYIFLDKSKVREIESNNSKDKYNCPFYSNYDGIGICNIRACDRKKTEPYKMGCDIKECNITKILIVSK